MRRNGSFQSAASLILTIMNVRSDHPWSCCTPTNLAWSVSRSLLISLCHTRTIITQCLYVSGSNKIRAELHWVRQLIFLFGKEEERPFPTMTVIENR